MKSKRKKKAAARKAAGKKKAAKKKAAKKKAAKKKAKTGAAYQIKIQNSKATSDDQHAKKNKAKHSPDSIYWTSKDIAYTVTFTGSWPFQRAADVAPRTIVVPASGDSKTFTVDDEVAAGEYGYDIQPPPAPAPGQPQPTPDVVVDE